LPLANQSWGLQLSDTGCPGDRARCLSRAQTRLGREKPDFPLSRHVTISDLGAWVLGKPLCKVLPAPLLNQDLVYTKRFDHTDKGAAAIRKDRSCSVLCCGSALPCPAQLSAGRGFLAGSCQEFLAVTFRCPSVQLLKAADGDVGCCGARPVALQAWFRMSRAYASSSIHTRSSQSLL
ncbi:hypothetical protein N332_01947, partial [Mesitornis unicolor]